MANSLLLKWDSLKGWSLESEAAMAALQRYFDAGDVSASAMAQRDTDEQRRALCELIDAVDGGIQNDWSGEALSKDEAKSYVLTYGQKS